ncbi:bifunctional phosphopantothenoylcysteine decarboxylase/phosphopantothenate--cysteine ligase CoaBC [Dongia rigui]|uniref:Coenzyme A biosynthesis bifunctional protein CoaBC n=1 Tax=Dongia rigui TaxID=940149 RepID=A0ABU5DWX1_9PROT|nr:bifunctional phosphopantothenoylcysteine decarboxylase/phosphopantothenate--cysteine ligase CoaBC [Dongia rigui]MDY0871814.1 bifunctional phosphopantothenoylcysteine decarboxylase/phosphopantothenate--cysteine ligase CoaBC [Dongia rigui]
MGAGKRVLLIIAGGIAAYKALDVIRRGRERGLDFRVILTRGGAEFVTPLSVASLAGSKAYTELFSLTDEAEMGHIRLVREADLVLVAPATADLIAKMAHGLADDLASTALLANDRPVLIAPSMNAVMWLNPAVQANVATLRARGVATVGPGAGDLACGEVGDGRLAEPLDIVNAALRILSDGPLKGLKALVTSGPTYEAIDPVRFIGNRSSGKQGHAIALALAAAGAEVTLVAGPTALADPTGCKTVRIESAAEMLAAVQKALPADIFVAAAAVADWRPAAEAAQKMKKRDGGEPPRIDLATNPDILATIAAPGPKRPRLVIGFAAETEKVVEYATAKRQKKNSDWILANDVSAETGTFGGSDNKVHLITADGAEEWPRLAKTDLAQRLVARIAATLKDKSK